MAKRISFLGDDGATYEAIPYDNTYPTGVITISEDSGGQAEDLARFEKTDVSDTFDEKGICQIYKNGVFNRYLIFDHQAFHKWQAQGGADVYVWKHVEFSDTTNEQTMTTGSGELSLANLDSGQSALPTFSGTVIVAVVTPYQARTGSVSTQASISSGNVTFGFTLEAGTGVAYYDVYVIQIHN